jgi:hypothetical protein
MEESEASIPGLAVMGKKHFSPKGLHEGEGALIERANATPDHGNAPEEYPSFPVSSSVPLTINVSYHGTGLRIGYAAR